jgi:hypothetical protein
MQRRLPKLQTRKNKGSGDDGGGSYLYDYTKGI